MWHLSQWRNISPITMQRPIANHPSGIELNANQITHLEHLKNQTLMDELKHTLIR